ncbi:LemA family protein [Methanovulcanius yangii]|uniref:LemA family protein n=1 Tax=Methanovulcanius yangii TaxID=1789227 RepID=UPI0029CA87D8|nr:LemA family protein [Methanovulcanius yangii]
MLVGQNIYYKFILYFVIITITAFILFIFTYWTIILWCFAATLFSLLIIYIIYWAIIAYNKFIRLKNISEEMLNQISVAMKFRLDTLEQLINSVKSYYNFEINTQIKVTKLRSNSFNKAINSKNIQQFEQNSSLLLGNVFALMENYPELKASETVLLLMNNITAVEKDIANYRYKYNIISREFNTLLDTIPSNFIGVAFKFEKLDYLQFSERINIVPKM